MSAAQTASDVYLSDFYRDQSDYSAPGQLLRVEPLSEKQSLAAAKENFRVLYSSTEGIWGNDLVAASGVLYLPKGDAPASGWPLVS